MKRGIEYRKIFIAKVIQNDRNFVNFGRLRNVDSQFVGENFVSF